MTLPFSLPTSTATISFFPFFRSNLRVLFPFSVQLEPWDMDAVSVSEPVQTGPHNTVEKK